MTALRVQIPQVNLMFPVVAFACDGHITPQDALERHFGVRVSTFADLPNAAGGMNELEQLVDEVQVRTRLNNIE